MSLGSWAGKAWGMTKGAAGAGKSWYGGLGSMAQHNIGGAAVGGLTGAFGLNPFNAVPFLGDIDAGGGIGGALAGAAAGAAFGKFGANKRLGSRGANRLMDLRVFSPSMVNSSRMNSIVAGAEKVSMFSNKHGDKVLSRLAAGSAGLIGGSMLSTNRPY